MIAPHGQIPRGTRVSPHFTFGELIVTDHRDFLDEQEDASPQVRANLHRLAVDVLEPARAIVGPLRVNSGYRCPGLNAAIGGALRSQHMDGLAADVVPVEMDLADAFERIVQSGIPWDQAIWEFGRWLHLSAPWHGHEPRRQALAVYEAGQYVKWTPSDPRFRAA